MWFVVRITKEALKALIPGSLLLEWRPQQICPAAQKICIFQKLTGLAAVALEENTNGKAFLEFKRKNCLRVYYFEAILM